MKKILAYLCLCFVTSIALADNLVLDNETTYPEQGKPGKIAVQWATTAEATQKANKAIINGKNLDLSTFIMLSKKGQTQLSLPGQAKYFRVVVWSGKQENPDLLTNWVDIVTNKTYIINNELLVPAVLISGSGC